MVKHMLTFPLSGVTYVEMGVGQTWQSMSFGTSTGILVVHNATTSSIIKNLNSGIFKGLLIADDVDKIHCDILGAVVVLTSSSPSGNCIGNVSGHVKYCSAFLTQVSSGISGGGGAYRSLVGYIDRTFWINISKL